LHNALYLKFDFVENDELTINILCKAKDLVCEHARDTNSHPEKT